MNKDIENIIRSMERAPHNTSFRDLKRVCIHYFGAPRINGSHHYFKMPWKDDPRICIQSKNGKAKPYQVKDVLQAVRRLERLGRGRDAE